jgi:hypothetical protein
MGQRGAGIAGWLRTAFRVRRASVPVGHTVRAALCVGLPVIVGFAIDDPVFGVTIGLACVLRTIGERTGPHRTNARNLLIATPLAACGYLFAPAQGLPLVALVALMAVVAFVAGVVSSRGEAFALGSMQLLLVTSIAIGVPDTGVVESLGLFFLGAAIYAAAMAVDYLLVEPERSAEVPAAAIVDPGATWRARLAVDRAVVRQASRLALCFGLAVSARGWFELSHWYWVPATVGLVMQPSFGSVPGRALLRAVGTAAGAVVSGLVIGSGLDGVGLGLVIGLLAATIPWSKLTSYALQSAALAAVVLLLVDQLDPASAVSLPVQRIAATAVGGVIVGVFGFALWPEARRLEAERTRTG